MDRITWLFEGEVEPAESVRRDAAWMRRAAAAGPVADPVIRFWTAPRDTILLGRFRRLPEELSTKNPAPALSRRLGGGRTVLSGPGFLNMSMVVPEARELTDRRGGASTRILTEKIMNRYVRGLLSGLNSLGVKAFYPGREWVTASGRRLAFISFDLDAAGVCLFESVIAVDGNAGRGDPFLASHGVVYQSGPGSPINVSTLQGAAPSRAGIGVEAVASAIAAGYAARTGVEVVRETSAPDDLPAVEPGGADWLASRSARSRQDRHAAVDIPVGALEVMLGTTDDGRLTHVTLAGDFLANSPAVAEYEAALEGCPAIWEAVGTITDRIFLTQPNTILGLGSLKTLPDTIMNAVAPAQSATS